MPLSKNRFVSALTACALIAGSLYCGAASAEARDLDEVRGKGVLRVALYNDFPPYSAEGKGIDFDVAGAIAEKIGVKLDPMWFTASDESIEDDLRNMVWKGHYLGTGPADAMIHAPVDPELMKQTPRVRFVAPYSRERLAVARDKNKVPRLDDLNDLDGLPIGVEDASLASIVLLSERGGKFRDKLRHFKTPALALEALRRGEVAAVIAQWGEAQGLLAGKGDYPVTAMPVLAGLGTRQWVVGIAVPKEHVSLGEAIESAMTALVADGTIDRIFASHGVTRLKP